MERHFPKFPKNRTTCEVYRNFRKFSPRSFPSIQLFSLGISRIFGWMVHILEIQQLPEFLETFSGKFLYHFFLFQISKGLVGMNRKRPQSVHCFFSLGVTWPCSNQWEQALLKKKIPVVIQKLFTIDQSFQKIRLESKDCFSCRWKISWSNGTSENVVMFLRTDCSSFRPSRPFFGKWNWFVQMVNAIPRRNLLVLCLPFAQTVNREVCPYKG